MRSILEVGSEPLLLFSLSERQNSQFYAITIFLKLFLPRFKVMPSPCRSSPAYWVFTSVTFSPFTDTPPCSTLRRASERDADRPDFTSSPKISMLPSCKSASVSVVVGISASAPPANSAFAPASALSASSLPCTSSVSSWARISFAVFNWLPSQCSISRI